MKRPETLGDLKSSGYRSTSVRDEMRRNLIARLRSGKTLFPGIVGYERTVIPQIQNAILAKHNFLLLGLRGQAKSRIIRQLLTFLDDVIPTIAGCPIRDDPLQPHCRGCRNKLGENGDSTSIEWIPGEARYREKMATPDVTVADLIGDVDPIKAATERRALSDELVIHYGIIPRTNRGIFAINELPDLPTRIQVALLNILEERDVQIRGFPVRIPLDILMVFTANPEDYTNRGNIITPLKDRIDSQILTHYPLSMDHARAITEQEAWQDRDPDISIVIPDYLKEVIEEIAIQARQSDYVDQNSGVSARLSISALENLQSAVETRAYLADEKKVVARLCDLPHAIPAISGKVELVFEGEQEGLQKVSRHLLGKAIKATFDQYLPDAYKLESKEEADFSCYRNAIRWFAEGGKIEVSDTQTVRQYFKALDKVPDLKKISVQYLKTKGEAETATGMEFILEGLHQSSIVAKQDLETGAVYKDFLGTMFSGMESD